MIFSIACLAFVGFSASRKRRVQGGSLSSFDADSSGTSGSIVRVHGANDL